jgi:hypothetical protein
VEACEPASVPLRAGDSKAPAATCAADVIFVFGRDRCATLSHDVAVTVAEPDVALRPKKNTSRMGRYAAPPANMAASFRLELPRVADLGPLARESYNCSGREGMLKVG